VKLYKFRSLGDDLSLCHAKETLQTGQFWCSHFWELNDPMEGMYTFSVDDGVDPSEFFLKGKAYRTICSFSGTRAFANPLMWGYYANGFKGIAIEIEVPKDEVGKPDFDKPITQIDYVKKSPDWSKMSNSPNKRIRAVLTTKLTRWRHEQEYRALFHSDRAGLQPIGTITGIYFGDPHRDTVNREQILARSASLRAFDSRRKQLMAVAQVKNIPCNSVRVDDGKVISNGHCVV